MIEVSVAEMVQRIQAPQADLVALLTAYNTPEYRTVWQQDARLYHTFGRALISAGHPTRAFELVREGLQVHKANPLLHYLSALALARGGNGAKALEQITTLLATPTLETSLQVESLSLAGRLAKDRYTRTHTPELRQQYAHDAAAYYAQAQRLSNASFPSINAATMFLLAGQSQKAQTMARLAMRHATAERQQPGRAEDYWLLATLGEACLHLGQHAAAVAWYGQAVAHAQGRFGDIASMRRQLALLAEYLDVGAEILALFNVGHVVVFAGHMIDHPSRQTPRFPADTNLEASVRATIAQALTDLDAMVGYSSAACGADLLFAEEMLKCQKELHIVLPFRREDFYATSVDFGLEAMASWRQRFDHVLAQATEVHDATGQAFLGDDTPFAFVNTVTQGLAITRAVHLGVEPYALVVQDPMALARHGGTAYFVQSWKARGQRQVVAIDLAALRSALASPPRMPDNLHFLEPAHPQPRLPREIKAMLFGDVKNFSRLGDEQIPAFLLNIFDHVAELVAQNQPPSAFCNTWGDGLFMVFDTVRDCARFALRFLAWLGTVPWETLGFPAETTVRLGLHAGPVYPYMDKILGRQNFFGSHVNRAARIEPVTTPGCAYVSEQFAAYVAVECGDEFVCDYVGVENLAKDYDRCPLYHLRPRG
jgi:class 3 adenylate cyclase